MNSSVITFPGSNCDRDMHVALKKFGFKNKMVWHDDAELPKSDLIPAYTEVAKRLGILHEQSNVSAVNVTKLSSVKRKKK